MNVLRPVSPQIAAKRPLSGGAQIPLPSPLSIAPSGLVRRRGRACWARY
jgi:hypothetical protein